MQALSILFAERNQSICNRIQAILSPHGCSVTRTPGIDLRRELLGFDADLAIIGPSLATIRAISELEAGRPFPGRATPLLLLTENSTEELAISALRAGVGEYLQYPCGSDELATAIRRCVRKAGGQIDTAKETDAPLIGESSCMREIKAYIARTAATGSNLLITGETGTGKELAARFLHAHSSRWNKPFVTVNCAAIPDSLIESELFGYERGAFTGAQTASEGKLKAAHGGTVFLDEIGDMSAYAQAKILRAIESKELQRLGGAGISVDIRIVAATNQDLPELARADRFRKDLYYRLNVAHVHLPPLRERKEDLPDLVGFYLTRFGGRFAQGDARLTDSAWAHLLAYDWPGNVRELKNFLEAVTIHAPSSEITPSDLPRHFLAHETAVRLPGDQERIRMLDALTANNWNKSKAAHQLKWSRMTLYRKMAKYQVSEVEPLRVAAAS